MSEDRKDEFESNDPDKKPAWEPLERMGQEPPAAPPGQGSGGYEPPRSNEDGNDEGGCGLMVAGAFVSILFTVLLTPMTLGTGNFGVLFIPPTILAVIGIIMVVKGENKAFGWGLIAGPFTGLIIAWGVCVAMLSSLH